MPRGFGAVRRAAADLENRRGSNGPTVFYFKLDPGQEAIVRFLEQDEDVFCADMHEIPVEGRQWGRMIPCLDQDQSGIACPGCERDMEKKFKGYLNLIWFNAPLYKRDSANRLIRDSVTNKPVEVGTKPQVAVWNSGIRLFEELEEINANFKGLCSRRFKIKRKGAGLDTKYSISPEDIDSGPQPMTDEEQRLAAEKPDLNQFTKPGTYEDFMRELNGGVGYTPSGQGDQTPVRTNPFIRNR